MNCVIKLPHAAQLLRHCWSTVRQIRVQAGRSCLTTILILTPACQQRLTLMVIPYNITAEYSQRAGSQACQRLQPHHPDVSVCVRCIRTLKFAKAYRSLTVSSEQNVRRGVRPLGSRTATVTASASAASTGSRFCTHVHGM